MTLMSTHQTFEELASGSLPNLGGDPLQPSWSRSLQELVAANQAFIGSNPQQPSASAQVLLGDRTDFGSLVASLDKPKPQKTEAFASIEATLRKHRDGTIERILRKEREHTQRNIEKAVGRQLEEDWAKEREWWMKEIVGTRNLVDSSNSLSLMPSDRQTETNFQFVSGPSHNLLTDAYGTSGTPLDTRMVSDHLQLVKSISSASNLDDVLSAFQRIASTDGYVIAWQLFSSMIPRLSSPFSGALGSLIHFCKQYQIVIKNRVTNANLAGQNVLTVNNYGTGLGGTVAAYSRLEFGANSSIWHILYFCLRCGDFVAAKSVLDVAAAHQENFAEQPLITHMIDQISQRQAQSSCIWETATPALAANDRELIIDLYDKTQKLEPNNVYKIGVFALLSGQALPESSYTTIEDYLFGHLWLALQQEDTTPPIESLGESIRKYGPDHFQAEESSGWAYVLPLLASQQFKTALAYLAEVGGSTGLLQATHLGLIFSLKGVDVGDLGAQTGSSGSLVTALLVKYAALLEGDASAGPIAALQYLLKIPEKDRCRLEIASLIARQEGLIDTFGGMLTEEGARERCILDEYLNRDEVSIILAASADIVKRQSHDRSKALLCAKLFMLADRYGSLLSLLNEFISPADDNSTEKRFWCDQSQQFYNTYLSRRTLVIESLERENSMYLVDTNTKLIQLRRFFDELRNNRYQEAFSIVVELGLLPFTQSAITEKEKKYNDLDPILKDGFPSLLSGTMECLLGLHRKVKSEARGINETVESRLKELQFLARFIYIFSGLIKDMPPATKQYIQEKRSHML